MDLMTSVVVLGKESYDKTIDYLKSREIEATNREAIEKSHSIALSKISTARNAMEKAIEVAPGIFEISVKAIQCALLEAVKSGDREMVKALTDALKKGMEEASPLRIVQSTMKEMDVDIGKIKGSS